MSSPLRVVGLVLLVLAAAGAAHFALIESGEVATVWIESEPGVEEATRLWAVEHEGSLWLNAGSPSAAWLRRIDSRPEVRVEFRGREQRYLAVPTPDARVAILARMAEEYGLADRWVRFVAGSESIPVRLEPLP